MHRQAIALALALALFSLPLSADQTRITFSDPAGDITPDEGDAHPIDIVNVDISSDGKFVVVAVTLAEPPRPTSLFQALVAGVAFDVDNNRKSGGQGFGGMHGDVPESTSSPRSSPHSKTAARFQPPRLPPSSASMREGINRMCCSPATRRRRRQRERCTPARSRTPLSV